MSTAKQANGTGSPRAARKHNRVADELGIAIVSGKYASGSVLPNEIEASERLGVSRTAYREAMRILTSKRLVESRPKAGTRVNPRALWSVLDPAVLGWMFETEPSESFIQGLFELRAIVEPAAAALAAERRSPSQLSVMGHAMEEMAKYGMNTPAGQAADQRFHEAILDATGNEAIIGLSETISSTIRWTTIFAYRSRRSPPDPIPAHRSLFAAIADGNPDAARSATLDLVQRALENTTRPLTER